MKVSVLILLVLAAAIFVSVGADTKGLKCPRVKPGQVGICIEACGRVNSSCTAPNGRRGICCSNGCGHTCYTG
ncbi:hypothetical protein HDE_04511 [Halotydeus destructor]|nr:hypothetical protein HDE_04511 [Halotydeus destructor]